MLCSNCREPIQILLNLGDPPLRTHIRTGREECEKPIRLVPAPDFRDLARRLAEALREQVKVNHAFHDLLRGFDSVDFEDCPTTSCVRDRGLLAEAKEKMGEGK